MAVIASITIGIDPILARLGPLELRWYGLLIMSGVVVGTAIAAREAPRRGIPSDAIWQALLLVVPAAVIGARLFHIVDNLGLYMENPERLLTLQLKGLAIYGALTGGALGIWLFARLKGLRALRILDLAAIGIPVGQLVGKLANVVNGDTWGTETDLPWAVVYTHPDTLLPDSLLGVGTHPTPVYEQLWLIVVVLVLFRVKDRLQGDGLLISLYLLLYSFGRFFVSIFRVNNPLLFGLKEAQLIALAALIILLPLFIWRVRQPGAWQTAASRAKAGRPPRPAVRGSSGRPPRPTSRQGAGRPPRSGRRRRSRRR